MLRLIVAALVCCLTACADKAAPEPSSEVDFSRPKSVVEAIFYAARSGDASHLPTLCDPRGEANASAKRVCQVAPGQPQWESFVRHFARGRVIGEPRVSGDSALLNFSYGPDGTVPETMELVRRDGRWHLLQF